MSEQSTYALLIYRTGEAELSEAANEAALAAHRALQQQVAAEGKLHAVAQLDSRSAGTTLRHTGSAHDVTDGPYIEAKEWLVGFYLLDCATQEEALVRGRQICPVADHAIEVRPVKWRWSDSP